MHDLWTKRRMLLALVAAILASFLVPAHAWNDDGVWNALGNALHFPLMGALTLALLGAWPSSVAPRARYAGVLFAGAATATLVELVQPAFGRTASVADLIFGLFGIGVAAVGHLAWTGGWIGLRAIHAVVTIGLLVSIAQPVGHEWRALRARAERFPLLGDFEDEVELRLWRDRDPAAAEPTTLKLSSEHVSSGRRSLAVHTGSGAWPGVIYLAGGADWRAYSHLAWDVYNPGEEFRLAVRIDDQIDSRFESSFHRTTSVAPGWNRLELPLDAVRRGESARELDLGRIHRLYFYADGTRPRLFFLDRVRLAGELARTR